MRKYLVGAIAGVAALAVSSSALLVAQPAAAPGPPVRCARFAPTKSTAYDPAAQAIVLPWRGDLPMALPTSSHAWQGKSFTDWRNYMDAVLSEVRAASPQIGNGRLTMKPGANWWIAPWMDYSSSGRERIHGLTNERGPNAGDLGPNSRSGLQVWAVGFYNGEGAYGLGQVFADPCNPKLPAVGWTFPANTASFKLLFTTATSADASYLAGSPEIDAMISGSSPKKVRLLQMDIAVKDTASPTGWVFGTYVWKGPPKGDGFLDNLVPVGLMWGNDPNQAASPRDAFATLSETRLNEDLAGVVWRGSGQAWPGRPWPGFQGRLNGPADNLRSSCLSCHALAQWPRSKVGIVPSASTYSLAKLNAAATRDTLRLTYLKNTVSGNLVNPADASPTPQLGGAVPLDYSLQIEASWNRMCLACADGALTGATPDMCKIKRGGIPAISTPSCPMPASPQFIQPQMRRLMNAPPRQ